LLKRNFQGGLPDLTEGCCGRVLPQRRRLFMDDFTYHINNSGKAGDKKNASQNEELRVN